MSDIKPNYNEFYDPRLVAIYNTTCPVDGYVKFYIELAKKLSAQTIIDIGCGTGLVTNELAKQGYQLIGVEPSALMLEVARKSPYGNGIKWVQGDALSLEEYHADLAIMTGHVAQFHLEDDIWLQALKTIYRALQPNGYIAFESRNPDVQPWASNSEQNFTDWYTPGFRQKVTDSEKGPMEIWLEVIEVKDKKVTTDIRYLFTNTGEELLSRNTLKFRSKQELTESLEAAGFSIEEVYGNWDGSLAGSESPELLFVAKRS